MNHPVQEISEKTWLISEFGLVNMYLLEGEDRALLVDTGSGVGDLAGDVRRLTNKPLTVLATHGHMDHCGGNSQFEAILLNQKDERLARETCGLETRRYFVQSRGPVRNPGKEEELLSMLQPDGDYRMEWISGGDVIDLGGRKIEIIATPGHTAGSVCLLDHKNRLLFTGDMCNSCLLMNLTTPGDEVTLAQYRQSMERLWARRGEYDKLVRSHEEPLSEKDIINTYIQTVSQMISGELTGEFVKKGFREGYVCYANGLEIWYLPDKLV